MKVVKPVRYALSHYWIVSPSPNFLELLLYPYSQRMFPQLVDLIPLTRTLAPLQDRTASAPANLVPKELDHFPQLPREWQEPATYIWGIFSRSSLFSCIMRRSCPWDISIHNLCSQDGTSVCWSWQNTSPEESPITQLPFLDLTSGVEVLSLDLSRIFHLILAFPKALSARRD